MQETWDRGVLFLGVGFFYASMGRFCLSRSATDIEKQPPVARCATLKAYCCSSLALVDRGKKGLMNHEDHEEKQKRDILHLRRRRLRALRVLRGRKSICHSVIRFESTVPLARVGGDGCSFFLSGLGCFTLSIPGYPAWFTIRALLYIPQTYADARARCSLFSHQWIPIPTLCRWPGNRHPLQTLRRYA